MNMMPLGDKLNELLITGLLAENRPEDGLLHASGDIVGPLRHTMLRMAGAPQKPDTTASTIRLRTGTLWHTELNRLLDNGWHIGQPVSLAPIHEVKVNDGLPDGWGGTADTLLPLPDGGFYLLDYKTTKGEGITYVDRDGAKPEHIAQVSAYYHALVTMGYDMRGCGVWYIPMNEDYKNGPVEPTLQELVPLPKDALFDGMTDRMLAVSEYLREYDETGAFLNTALAPVMAREQKLFKKGDKWDVSLVPHWSSMFCPYSDDLCDCGTGGSTKIGHFEGGSYWPRQGYESYTPTVRPKGAYA